ncbi:hypothetical protein J2X73_002752 [Novosphingobium sp. 1748]|uniref:hypothetical protein n=1 Tax=Novosphingobium sp. 1748 TaxID=2817760 RepID=UPI0028641570|nr:hypothetical protein [Novosphingobium sp. 1748]MDR6708373.1 hypothetical protein [Novosphingobium sp. 1748]
MEWRPLEGGGRVALNQFLPRELALATGLSTDLQRVWRRRGHLPEREEGFAHFNSVDVAAISVRYELSRMGVAPGDTARIGEEIARLVLYFALLSDDCVASVRGGLRRLTSMGAGYEEDDELAQRVSGVQDRRRYLWSAQPPQMALADDITPLLSQEQYSAMLHLDLVVIGKRLAENSPKPLFLIDLKV